MTRALFIGMMLTFPAVAPAQTYLVVVTGLAGEPKFGAIFRETASTLIDGNERMRE